MRLILVRHTPTGETGKKLTGRLAGVPLSPAGRQQAASLAEALSDIAVDTLYTSPVQRCRETARPLGATWDLRPVAYRSFIEVDYGAWAGRSLASLRRTKSWEQLHRGPSRFRFPGGESIAEVQVRAVAGCEELASIHGTHTVTVVSHADVIKTIVAHYLGAPLDLYQRIVISPGSVTVVELPASASPRVAAVNQSPGGSR